MGRTCSIGKKLIDFRMVHRVEIQTPIDSRNVFYLGIFFSGRKRCPAMYIIEVLWFMSCY